MKYAQGLWFIVFYCGFWYRSISQVFFKITTLILMTTVTSLWRHNGHDGVSNHQPHDCLLNCLFSRRSKQTSKLRVTGLCAGNSPGTGEFPAQMASNAENVSIDDVIMNITTLKQTIPNWVHIQWNVTYLLWDTRKSGLFLWCPMRCTFALKRNPYTFLNNTNKFFFQHTNMNFINANTFHFELFFIQLWQFLTAKRSMKVCVC